MKFLTGVEELQKALQSAVDMGHTHVKIFQNGRGDVILSLKKDVKDIANRYGDTVYGVLTGFPIYSNYNRYEYDPVISGITGIENNSYNCALSKFMKKY